MLKFSKCLLLFAFVITRVQTFSLTHEPDRLTGLPRAHARLEAQDSRLLPSLQDLEVLKKVAQVLVTIGEQVIPSIIGDGSTKGSTTAATEVPHDPVHLN